MASIVNPDIDTPFASIEDAFNRLVSYHIFNNEELASIDAREAENMHEPATELVLTRDEAWQQSVAQRAFYWFHSHLQTLQKIEEIEKSLLDRSEIPHLQLESYATAEVQDMYNSMVTAELIAKRKAEEEKAAREREKVEAAERADREKREAEEAAQQAELKAKQEAEARAAAAALAPLEPPKPQTEADKASILLAMAARPKKR